MIKWTIWKNVEEALLVPGVVVRNHCARWILQNYSLRKNCNHDIFECAKLISGGKKLGISELEIT